jgi:hypothetical protein
MLRRRAVLGLGLLPVLPGPGAMARAETPPAAAPPAHPDPAVRQRELEGWWQRQRQREAEDRFWNHPREQRRNLTRDQIERWERMRDRAHRQPSWPF